MGSDGSTNTSRSSRRGIIHQDVHVSIVHKMMGCGDGFSMVGPIHLDLVEGKSNPKKKKKKKKKGHAQFSSFCCPVVVCISNVKIGHSLRY